MKTFKLMIAAAVALFAVVGCSKDTTEDALTMGTTEISVPAAGSTQPLTFTANTSWTVSSDQDWVTFDRMSGDAGEATVNMTVEANPDYENRTATVTIKAGTKTTLFKVVQKMLETFSAEFVYEIGPEEQTIEFTMESNKEYEFLIGEECESWIRPAASSKAAPEPSVAKFAVSANTSVAPREGRIVAKVGDVAYALIVKQNADFEYMTAAVATCYGRTMKIYDSASQSYLKYDEYGIELTNEDGVKVVLAVNVEQSNDYLSGLPVGTYTVDASAAHAPGTFSIKTLDSSETVYTTIFEGETETVVEDGEISIQKEGSVYTILASLVDSRENVMRYSFIGEIPTIEDKTMGAYLSSVASKGVYNTYYTSKANWWSFNLYISKGISDVADAFPAVYISFDIYSDSADEFPTGTFVYRVGEKSADIDFNNGKWTYKVGEAAIDPDYGQSFYDDNNDDQKSCKAKDGGTVTISKNADGTYKFDFDVDLVHEIGEYDDDYNWVVTDTEEYTYNGTIDNVKAPAEIDRDYLKPVDDGDFVLSLSTSAMTGFYWGGKTEFDALSPSYTFPENNSLITCSIANGIDMQHAIAFNVCAPGWVFEKNYANRFCNTPLPDGTYNFSYTPADTSVVPLLMNGATSYNIFTNGYTGTTFFVSGGSLTVNGMHIDLNLEASPFKTVDGKRVVDTENAVAITGGFDYTVSFFQDYSTRTNMVGFWAGPSGN